MPPLLFCQQMQGNEKEAPMSTLLFIILVLLLIGALPSWPYSNAWGYYPSGFFGILLIVLIILAATGRI